LQQSGLSANAALNDVDHAVVSAPASPLATNSVLVTGGLLTLALIPPIRLARGPLCAARRGALSIRRSKGMGAIELPGLERFSRGLCNGSAASRKAQSVPVFKP